jgi:SAM-dependent methyltransferase
VVFSKEYAGVYDPLYQDKDYEKECDRIEALFQACGCCPKTVLDLGCGTGGHALVLAKRGYKVTGVDRSPDMLDIARRKARDTGVDVEFIAGDIAAFGLERKFDAVISMFAVMCYQVTNSAVSAVCRRAKEALVPGGLFMFDYWHGPAVIAERPARRTKVADGPGGQKITRRTEPEWDLADNIVKVHITTHAETANRVSETCETHVMRYFFPQEIRSFLASAGFSDIGLYPFPDMHRPLSEKDWNILVVGRCCC